MKTKIKKSMIKIWKSMMVNFILLYKNKLIIFLIYLYFVIKYLDGQFEEFETEN
jgi:hypothetical protein